MNFRTFVCGVSLGAILVHQCDPPSPIFCSHCAGPAALPPQAEKLVAPETEQEFGEEQHTPEHEMESAIDNGATLILAQATTTTTPPPWHRQHYAAVYEPDFWVTQPPVTLAGRMPMNPPPAPPVQHHFPVVEEEYNPVHYQQQPRWQSGIPPQAKS
jgi:hypothetical protein